VKVFVDTSALLAILDEDDRYHREAAETFRELMVGTELVTHNYIEVETLTLARRRLGRGAVARLTLGAGVGSHRADLTILECSKALAALAGRREAGEEDVLEAAGLALGHRLPADPFGPAPKLEPQTIRRLLEEALEVEVTRKKASSPAP